MHVVRMCYLGRSNAGERLQPHWRKGGVGIWLRHWSGKWERAQLRPISTCFAETGCGSRRQTADYDAPTPPSRRSGILAYYLCRGERGQKKVRLWCLCGGEGSVMTACTHRCRRPAPASAFRRASALWRWLVTGRLWSQTQSQTHQERVRKARQGVEAAGSRQLMVRILRAASPPDARAPPEA